MQDRWITDSRPNPKLPHYTRGNAGEVLPEPLSPLGWTLVWERGVVPGCRDGFITFGVVDYDEFTRPDEVEAFGLFGGYFYNPLSMARLMGVRMPGASAEAIDAAYFDARDDVPPYVPEPWHESERHATKLAEVMGWIMSGEPFTEIDDEKVLADRLRDERPDLTKVSDSHLVARARSMLPWLNVMFEHNAWASLGASLGPGALGAVAEAVGDPTITTRLMAGIGDIDSAAPSWGLWELSRMVRASSDLTLAFDGGLNGLIERIHDEATADGPAFHEALQGFLHEFGSRGPNEWDLRADTWETKPMLALAAVDRMRALANDHSPSDGYKRVVAERQDLAHWVRKELAENPELQATFEAASRSAAIWLAARERGKTNMIKVIGEVRMCMLELGKRMTARGHLAKPELIWMLMAPELDAFRFNPERFGDLLAQRESEWRELFDLEPPYIMSNPPTPMSQWKRKSARVLQPAQPGDVLKGVGGSAGVATGIARIITDPSDPTALDAGDILVCESTDPGWTPLFVAAGAVVAAIGNIGSHTMIVSRELGIPCVVSVENCTLRIPNGARITVDGTNGTITIL